MSEKKTEKQKPEKKFKTLPNGNAETTLPSGLVVEFWRPGPFTNAQALAGIPSYATQEVAVADFEDAEDSDGQVGKKRVARRVRVTMKDIAESRVFNAIRLCLCSVRPRLTTARPPERGRKHLDTLPKIDFDFLLDAFEEFVDEAGEAAAAIPLAETSLSSSHATNSGSATENDQASSQGPTN